MDTTSLGHKSPHLEVSALAVWATLPQLEKIPTGDLPALHGSALESNKCYLRDPVHEFPSIALFASTSRI